MNAATIILGVIGAGVQVLLVEVGKTLVLTEAQTRLERLPQAILRLARQRLAPRHRNTIYQEEWLPDLEFIARETGGLPITRLVRSTRFAIGLLWSARAISGARDEPVGNRFAPAPALDAPGVATVAPARFTRFQHDAMLAIRTILSHQPDLPVLSIEGPWGSGKTSVLAQVHHLDTDTDPAGDAFSIVSFDPWRREHEGLPAIGVVDAIESAVADAGRQTDGRTRRPWHRLRSAAGRRGRPGRGSWGVLGAPRTPRGNAGQGPVVVLIDDVDRCCPETVLAVLDAVRVLSRSGANGCRFVLAFDPDCLVAHLDRASAATVGPSEPARVSMSGLDFLEKLVSFRAWLPVRLRPLPPTSDIANPPFPATDQ